VPRAAARSRRQQPFLAFVNLVAIGGIMLVSVRGIQRVNSFATRVRFDLRKVTMDFAGTPEEKLKFASVTDLSKVDFKIIRPTVCPGFPPATIQPVPKKDIGNPGKK
jgi:hypothetical protein